MIRTTRTIALFAVLALWMPGAAAQVDDLDLRLPWDMISETMALDGKTSTVVYTGLRLSQGSISIEADEGRVDNLEQKNSSWQFNGNVVIDIENGHIECEAANLRFADYQLRHAVVTGSPATFELKRPGSDDITYAEAGRLSYDVVAGIVEFTEEATITEAGNQISSELLVYNIIEERINADSGGPNGERVRIVYTPTNGTPEDSQDDAETVDPGDEDGSQ